ncbi:hypothetical protein GMSM_29680 [Geomonas sp. Red276]
MKSEGVRRLSLLIGTICCVLWAIFAIVLVTDALRRTPIGYDDLFVAVFGLGITFFGPYFLVRGIAWVVEGFKSGDAK